MTMKKITAGRDVLGEFAPKFAQLNDDVLFGEVWSRESELSARDRSLITVTALMAQGLTDTSFGHHLAMAKENGITRSEIAEILIGSTLVRCHKFFLRSPDFHGSSHQ